MMHPDISSYLDDHGSPSCQAALVAGAACAHALAVTVDQARHGIARASRTSGTKPEMLIISVYLYPICSMYGIFTYTFWVIFRVNVAKYSSTMEHMGMEWVKTICCHF